MKNKLLVICGQTATGKTKLGLKFAEALGGEIISADSRQVYKLMDVGTGKDIPPKFKIQNSKIKIDGHEIIYYSDGKIRIWGYDLVDPRKNFSISGYKNIVDKVLVDIYKRDKLPIIVGGSGLYIKSLVDAEKIQTINIAQNTNLRKKLEKYTTEELYEELCLYDLQVAESLNESDRKNRRRLIRKIEICKSNQKKGIAKTTNFDTFFVGLKTKKTLLYQKIKKRVYQRLRGGFLDELEQLKKRGLNERFQSMQTPGYKHFLRNIDKVMATDLWIQSELNYAKRQITWFNKDERIHWVNSDSQKDLKNLVKKVTKWYKDSDVQKS